MRRTALILSLAGLALAAACGASGAASSTSAASPTTLVAPGSKVSVALYSDSIAYESIPHITRLLAATGRTSLDVHSFPGTSMCAWKQQMNTDATTRHPQAVLLQFTGTPYSPCAQVGAWGSPEFLAHLRQVAVQTAQLFIGHGASRVYLVGAPVSVDSTPSSPDAKVSDVYRSVARLLGHRVVFVDAGRSVETAVGGFTWTRPCLVSEVKASPSLCTGGIKDHVRVNVVRQPDGVHFCPTPWPSDIFPPQGCPTYASGAYRYGVAMVAPLIHDYSLGSPPSLREVSPSGGS